MQRVGFLLKVKPDLVAEYQRRHQAVWPEMLDALRRTGWHNYSIFLNDDGLLFGYVEVEDSLAASLNGMSTEDANQRWQDYMADFFEIPPGAHADQSMIELKEVFHLA